MKFFKEVFFFLETKKIDSQAKKWSFLLPREVVVYLKLDVKPEFGSNALFLFQSQCFFSLPPVSGEAVSRAEPEIIRGRF